MNLTKKAASIALLLSLTIGAIVGINFFNTQATDFYAGVGVSHQSNSSEHLSKSILSKGDPQSVAVASSKVEVKELPLPPNTNSFLPGDIPKRLAINDAGLAKLTTELTLERKAYFDSLAAYAEVNTTSPSEKLIRFNPPEKFGDLWENRILALIESYATNAKSSLIAEAVANSALQMEFDHFGRREMTYQLKFETPNVADAIFVVIQRTAIGRSTGREITAGTMLVDDYKKSYGRLAEVSLGK